MKREIYGYQIYREVMKRGRPIWFYAINIREVGSGHEIVRCVMDVHGNITPRPWRPYRGWGNEIIYYPNYWFAWAMKLNLDRRSA